MKTRKPICQFILLLLPLLLLPAHKTMAQPTRGIILLGNFQQATNLSYQYDGQTSSTSSKSELSSREHHFSEAYRFDIDYGIYSTRLLKGHFGAELKLDQELFNSTGQPSGSSVGHDILYNLNGTFLGRHPYPINFFATSGVSKVQRAFAGSFDLNTDSYGVGFFLKNKFLPLQFNYSQNTSVTSGLGNDREQTLENFSLTAKHKVRDFSFTEAAVVFSSFRTGTKGEIATSDSFLTNDFNFNNQLTWSSKGRGRSLSTGFRYRQETGDRESNSSDFSEALAWDIGKTLKTGASYTNSFQKARTDAKQEHSGDLWLKHYLFQNLQTYVQLRGRSTDFSTGKEQEVSGTVNVDYQKILPAESLLQLGFTQTYGVVDRKLTDTKITIRGERIVATFLGRISLKNPDVVAGTVGLTNADRTKRAVPYVEGAAADYTVEQIGRDTFITINPGGQISTTDILIAEYQIDVNPSVKYANSIRSIHGTLLLFEKRYRLFTGLDEYGQDFLAGRADTVNLVTARTYRAGMEVNGTASSFMAEYTNHRSTSSVYQSLDGAARFTKEFAVSSVALYVKDRVTLRENPPSIAAGSNSDTENALSIGSVYRRPFLDVGTVKLTADYLNIIGKNRRDALSLGFGIQARVGRVIAELKSNFHWLITDVSTRRDDLVRLDVTRYF